MRGISKQPKVQPKVSKQPKVQPKVRLAAFDPCTNEPVPKSKSMHSRKKRGYLPKPGERDRTSRADLAQIAGSAKPIAKRHEQAQRADDLLYSEADLANQDPYHAFNEHRQPQRAAPPEASSDDREGRPEECDLDHIEHGRNDLKLEGIRMPCVGGRGALDLSKFDCAFGCEECDSTGYDLQTLAEVDEQAKRTHATAHPGAPKAEIEAAGTRAVVRTLELLEIGPLAAIKARVSCNNWRCLLASGILLEEDRARYLAGNQDAAFINGNKRHNSRKLFVRNVTLVRALWSAKALTRKQVATAMLDISHSTFLVESRQREFFGVAVTLAERAADMGYPLTGRDAKHAFIARMGQVPTNYINTILRGHVLSKRYDTDHKPKKSWDTELEYLLKQKFPDALTTAHADMLHQNWRHYGEHKDAIGAPLHAIDVMDLHGGLRSALFDGAEAWHSVVAPYFVAAHQHKIKLLFDSTAFKTIGGDTHGAISANAKCMGLKTAGQKAEFERFVSMHKNVRERTTALIPSAGKLDSPYAPSDNRLREAQNCDVWAKNVAALTCLNVEQPEALAASYLDDHKKNKANGHTIRPAKRVADPHRTKSAAAHQRAHVFKRNAFAGYGPVHGRARRDKERLFKAFTLVRGRVSLVGFRIHNPTDAELSASASLVAAHHERAHLDRPIPETLAKDVVRTTPRAARHDALDEVATSNAMENYERLVEEGLVDESCTFEAYCRCDPTHFWRMAQLARLREKRRWWELGRANCAWRCDNPACAQSRLDAWSTSIADDACQCAKSKSFNAYLKAFRIEGRQRWPTVDAERDRFARQRIVGEQANVDRLRDIANRTEDDSEKILKLTVELETLKERAPTAKLTTQAHAIEKKINTSKGMQSLEVHAKALCHLTHALSRTVSRFVRDVDDRETAPLRDGFDAELERISGSGAKRFCAQRAHRSGHDGSVYTKNQYAAAARAIKSGLIGTCAPEVDSDSEDDMMSHAARLLERDERRRSEEAQDERVAREHRVLVAEQKKRSASASASAEAKSKFKFKSEFELQSDAPLSATRLAELLDGTERTTLKPSRRACDSGARSKTKCPKRVEEPESDDSAWSE